jgi:single-strand DNA-binding protein
MPSSTTRDTIATPPIAPAAAAGTAFNLALVRGRVAAAPSTRVLGDGSTSISFDLITELADGRSTVPVVVDGPFDPDVVVEGADVMIAGVVRRRFFRAGGATVSRTEVVAGVVERVGVRGPGVRSVRRVAGIADRSLGPAGVATLRSVLGALEGAS